MQTTLLKIFLIFCLSILPLPSSFASESKPAESRGTFDGAGHELKEGFKETGHEIKEGSKKAGRSIKKGSKKVGHEIKNTFK